MSFSVDVKNEIAGIIPAQDHCMVSELAAYIMMCGKVLYTEGSGYSIRIITENQQVADKFQTLLKACYDYEPRVFVKWNETRRKSGSYTVIIDDDDIARDIIISAGYETAGGEEKTGEWTPDSTTEFEFVPSEEIFYDNCCRRAFVRGTFLCGGNISNPEKFNHLEIVCTQAQKADFLLSTLQSFEVAAKTVIRKKYYVVYVKETEQIEDIINICEAHKSLLELEEIRVIKEVRNSINRQVNCEAANINRTVNAAVKQIEDIEYIDKKVGLETLGEGLRDLAKLRLENTEVSLKELGEMLNPPVGKSGVNHRLRKISEIADELRSKFGGE